MIIITPSMGILRLALCLLLSYYTYYQAYYGHILIIIMRIIVMSCTFLCLLCPYYVHYCAYYGRNTHMFMQIMHMIMRIMVILCLLCS